jgi:hypothetical protein
VQHGKLGKEAANAERAQEGLEGGHGRQLERHVGSSSCSAY